MEETVETSSYPSRWDFVQNFSIRSCLASLFGLWFHQLNYSPLYLQGFIFAMHQGYNITNDTQEGYMGEGTYLLYQEEIYPTWLRVVTLSLVSMAVWVLLKLERSSLTVWTIHSHSFWLASLLSCLRCLQEKMKIWCVLHSWFFYYVTFFGVAVVQSIHWGGRQKLKAKDR